VRGGLAVVAFLLLPPAATPARAQEPAPLEEYVGGLEAVRDRLREGRLEEARVAARDLRSRAFAWGDETLAADASALDAAAAASSAAEAARAAARLSSLVDALRAAGGGEAGEPRPEILRRVAPADHLVRGGAVGTLRVTPRSLPEQVVAALLSVYDRVASALGRLLDWLDSLRPQGTPKIAARGDAASVAIVFAVAGVLVLAFLAWRARGSRSPLAAAESSATATASRRDEDPLSRGAPEWERHAAELAAARRWREAIRAWYHAALVSLFRAGLLHYQKGRTNWEYVARLDPGLGWRPSFIALTSLFDREWYGRRASDAEALAECARGARAVLEAVRGKEAA
jgi:hypothetical protein